MASEPRTMPPYVGPRPFKQDEADRARFFGRDRETEEIISLIYSQPIVLVYAQSGAGKTSLFNARIAPALEDEGFQVLPLARVQSILPSEVRAEEIANLYVFNGLLNLAPDADPRTLARSSLAGFLQECPRPAGAAGRPVLRVLIFDQFEELFNLFPQGWPAQREDFFRQLVEALKADPLLRVVLVMREEYLAQLEPYMRALPDGLRARFRLERLNAEDALRAVVGPLADTGCAFAPGVAEKLVEELLKIRTSAPGGPREVEGQHAEPVQLQVVCLQLWNSLPAGTQLITPEHVQAFGDVDRALAAFYEQGVTRASREARVPEGRLRAWVDKNLITPAGTRGFVFRGERETEGLPNAAVELLDRLYLIRPEERAGARWYELTHDRLIEPILRSNRAWEEHRDRRRLYYALAALAVVVPVAVLLLLQSGRSRQELAKADVTAAAQVTAVAQVEAAAEATAAEARAAVEAATTRAVRARATAEAAATVQFEAANAAATAEAESRLAQSKQLAAFAAGYLAGQLDLGLLLDVEAYRAAPSVEASQGLLGALQYSPSLGRFLHGHTAPVTSVALSPDSRTIAAGNNNGEIILWDAQTGQPTQVLTATLAPIGSMAFSPNDTLLWSESNDGAIMAWDVRAGQSRRLRGPAVAIEEAAFSLDGRKLALATSGGEIRLWDLENERSLSFITTTLPAVESMAFDPAGQVLAAGGCGRSDPDGLCARGEIQLWDVSDPQRPLRLREPLRGHNDRVWSLAFSQPDGRWLASGSSDGSVIVWDRRSGAEEKSTASEQGGARGLAFAPGGTTLAWGSPSGVMLWDGWQEEALLRSLPGHGDATVTVDSVAFAADGRTMVSGGSNGTVILWDTKAGIQPGMRLPGYRGVAHSASFSPDGKLLVTAGDDDIARLWDAATGQEVGQLTGHKAVVRSAAFSPDGKMVVTGSDDNTARLWDAATGRQVVQMTHDNAVNAVAFSPDGRLVVSGGDDNTARLWDAASGREVARMAHDGPVNAVAFSPDGRLVLSGGDDNAARLWDSATGQELRTLAGHTGPVSSATFSPDGRLAATASNDGTARLWDVKTGDLVRELTGHTAAVTSVTFSPDGTLLASGGGDQAVILWETATGKNVGSLAGHRGAVYSLAFDPAGGSLASGGDDGVILWNLDAGSWQRLACRMANRNLSPTEWDQFLPDQLYRESCPELPAGTQE